MPAAPKESAARRSVDVVNSNTRTMAKLLAMGLACNQTRVFKFVHTAGASETYLAGQSKIYHQITHDEPTDAKLGYQPETSKLAELVMQGLGDFLTEIDAIKEGDGTLLDNMLIMAFSDTGYAKIHSIENIPMFLAGRAGGRHKAGQHIARQGRIRDARFAHGDAARWRAGRRVRFRHDENRASDHRSHGLRGGQMKRT